MRSDDPMEVPDIESLVDLFQDTLSEYGMRGGEPAAVAELLIQRYRLGMATDASAVRALAQELVLERGAEKPGTDALEDHDRVAVSVDEIAAMIVAVCQSNVGLPSGGESWRSDLLLVAADLGEILAGVEDLGIEVPRSLLERHARGLEVAADRYESGIPLDPETAPYRHQLSQRFADDARAVRRLLQQPD